MFDISGEGGSLRWLSDYQTLLLNAFADIEHGGFPFSVETHEDFTDKVKDIVWRFERELQNDPDLVQFKKLNKKDKFNLNSSVQLAAFLFGDRSKGGLGLAPFKLTKKGAPSTDKESLSHFAESSEFCKKLMILKNYTKIDNSFGEGMLKHYSEKTKSVHPVYFLAKVVDGTGHSSGTFTGRLSCSNPNLQQIPKRNTDDQGLGVAGIDVRRSFVPDPGCLLVEIDQSQVEVRVAGMYAKDTQMGEFFRLGGDFHTRVAAMVSGEDYELMKEAVDDPNHPKHKDYKKLRSIAKATTFGLLYGMGLSKLTRENGMTEAEGEEFIRTYFSIFPHLNEWRQEMIEFAERFGYVVTLFGRKRQIKIRGYETDDGRESRIGINTPVQSAAADITLYGLAIIWKELALKGYKTRILGTIHDSIIFSIPDEELNAVIPWVTEWMMNPPGLEWLLEDSPVPLSVGVDIGPNFRDMVEIPLELAQSGKLNPDDYRVN